jgi:predicted transglutaminase-like cysteine proteinase
MLGLVATAPAKADAPLRIETASLVRPALDRGVWRPVMAPLAHVRFCIENPGQCERRRVSIRKRSVALTAARMTELETVNRVVNAAIRPVSEGFDVMADRWRIAPATGDCDDYAVTKRAHLLGLGWPSSALLLTQVSHSVNESHLVLTVRTVGGDFVLDNLHRTVRPFARYAGRVEKMQSPVNPANWMTTRTKRPAIAVGIRAPAEPAVEISQQSESISPG